MKEVRFIDKFDSRNTGISVGKQSPCMLSFVYMSYERARVRTAHNFGNRVLLFSY